MREIVIGFLWETLENLGVGFLEVIYRAAWILDAEPVSQGNCILTIIDNTPDRINRL